MNDIQRKISIRSIIENFISKKHSEKDEMFLNIENAKKAYQSAWNAVLERKQDRQILQIKLESVGILVDDPDFERPVIQTQVDES